MGENDPRWDKKTVTTTGRVPLSVGYPPGTEETSIGNNMFRRNTPSAKGVYTFEKINYSAEKYRKIEPQPKTGEKVYWRLVEESDVEAIKEAFELDY